MDRRSWLGIATLVILGLLYLQIPPLSVHQIASQGRLDLSTWNFDQHGAVQLDSHWYNWRIEGSASADNIRYSLDLGNIGHYLYAEDLSLLFAPSCQQPLTTYWQNLNAHQNPGLASAQDHSYPRSQQGIRLLSFLQSEPEIIPLEHYLQSEQNTLQIHPYTHPLAEEQEPPCVNIYIGNTHQLYQLMSWSKVKEIAPIALMAIILLTLVGRAFVQGYYRDLLFLGAPLILLMLFSLAKSSALLFSLAQMFDVEEICKLRLSVCALACYCIISNLGTLKYIRIDERFLPTLHASLGLTALCLPLAFVIKLHADDWATQLLLGIYLSSLLLFILAQVASFSRKALMAIALKGGIDLAIALSMLNIFTQSFDDYQLIAIITSLVLVMRINLTLYPNHSTKLAPHEKSRLEADIRRHTRSLQAKNEELEHTRQALERANHELTALSFTDGLTGAYNRLYFDRQFLVEWQRARREQENLSLILIDIDHFKQLNDRYGHLAGDEGLKQVTKLLQKTFVRGNDFVCRYGGEEFVILLPNTATQQAAVRAEKVRREIENTPIEFEEQRIAVTCSIGIAGLTPQEEHQPLDLLHAADQALYWVKRNGRNGAKIANYITATPDALAPPVYKDTEDASPEAG